MESSADAQPNPLNPIGVLCTDLLMHRSGRATWCDQALATHALVLSRVKNASCSFALRLGLYMYTVLPLERVHVCTYIN